MSTVGRRTGGRPLRPQPPRPAPRSARADFNIRLGASLHRRRLQARVSQDAAARAAGITQASVSNYEHGLREPSHWIVTQLESLYADAIAARGKAA